MDSGRSYDTDLALWAEDQARALRDAAGSGVNLPIDWENVAEEIEALGKAQSRELSSRISTILVHLMKLEASPAKEPRAGWKNTILEQRGEIERLIEDSPSLRRLTPDYVEKELPRARRLALSALATHDHDFDTDMDRLAYTAEQVLGDWLPPGA